MEQLKKNDGTGTKSCTQHWNHSRKSCPNDDIDILKKNCKTFIEFIISNMNESFINL